MKISSNFLFVCITALVAVAQHESNQGSALSRQDFAGHYKSKDAEATRSEAHRSAFEPWRRNGLSDFETSSSSRQGINDHGSQHKGSSEKNFLKRGKPNVMTASLASQREALLHRHHNLRRRHLTKRDHEEFNRSSRLFRRTPGPVRAQSKDAQRASSTSKVIQSPRSSRPASPAQLPVVPIRRGSSQALLPSPSPSMQPTIPRSQSAAVLFQQPAMAQASTVRTLSALSANLPRAQSAPLIAQAQRQLQAGTSFTPQGRVSHIPRPSSRPALSALSSRPLLSTPSSSQSSLSSIRAYAGFHSTSPPLSRSNSGGSSSSKSSTPPGVPAGSTSAQAGSSRRSSLSEVPTTLRSQGNSPDGQWPSQLTSQLRGLATHSSQSSPRSQGILQYPSFAPGSVTSRSSSPSTSTSRTESPRSSAGSPRTFSFASSGNQQPFNILNMMQHPDYPMPVIDLAHNAVPVRPGRHIVSPQGSILGDRDAIPIGSPVSAEQRAALQSGGSSNGGGNPSTPATSPNGSSRATPGSSAPASPDRGLQGASGYASSSAASRGSRGRRPG